MTASNSGITHIGVVPVYVTDQQRALEFYRDSLGFEVHTDASWGDQRWIEVGPSGAATRLSLMRVTDVPFDAQVGLGPAIAFRTPDAAASHSALIAAGAAVTSEPKVEMWGTWYGFEDPDGNSFVVSESDS